MEKSNLFTVKQFAQLHPAFSVGSLRMLIFKSEQNGLRKALRRIGGRVLINETLFFNWVEEINNKKLKD